MTEPQKISFVTFDEAVALARLEPGAKYFGMHFVAPFKHLGTYSIGVEPEDSDYVSISYEGGPLFSTCGEEGFYDLVDVPAEAKDLFYARLSDLADGDAQILGMTSEFVLEEVLPGLSADAKYRDRAHFIQVAGAQFQSFWRQA